MKQKGKYLLVTNWFPLQVPGFKLLSEYKLPKFDQMKLGIRYTDEVYQISKMIDLSKGLSKPKLILSGNIKLNKYLYLSYRSEHANMENCDPKLNRMPFRK